MIIVLFIFALQYKAYAHDLTPSLKGLDLSIQYFVSRIKELEHEIQDLKDENKNLKSKIDSELQEGIHESFTFILYEVSYLIVQKRDVGYLMMEHSKTSDRLTLLEEKESTDKAITKSSDSNNFYAFRVSAVKEAGSSAEEQITRNPGLRIDIVKLVIIFCFKLFGSKLNITLARGMTKCLGISLQRKVAFINSTHKQVHMAKIMLVFILLSLVEVSQGRIEMKIKSMILFLWLLSFGFIIETI